jgi:hypothetical protein
MPDDIGKKIAFWCLSETSTDIEHLYFVISDICRDSNNVLVVNMTTLYDEKFADLSCILDIKDHPSVKHKSYVLYKEAMEVSIGDIMVGIMKKDYKRVADISDNLLKKIQDGAKKSKFFPSKFKKFYECF